MPRNDEGEFELVLGNRQLLSGFFIVVILFGVFFTMGYIVGRHSSPLAGPAPLASAGTSTSRPSRDASPSPATEEVSTPAETPITTKPATGPPVSPAHQ